MCSCNTLQLSLLVTSVYEEHSANFVPAPTKASTASPFNTRNCFLTPSTVDITNFVPRHIQIIKFISNLFYFDIPSTHPDRVEMLSNLIYSHLFPVYFLPLNDNFLRVLPEWILSISSEYSSYIYWRLKVNHIEMSCFVI